MPNNHAVDTTPTRLNSVADSISLYSELLNPGVSGEAKTLSFTACNALAAELKDLAWQVRRLAECL